MSEDIDLWVCPNCEVLMGIQTELHEDKLLTNCLNCGVSLQPSKISFLNLDLVTKIQNKILELFDTFFHEDIRFSWVSNRTLGVIFELERTEIEASIDFDIYEKIEDELADKYQLTITLYFS